VTEHESSTEKGETSSSSADNKPASSSRYFRRTLNSKPPFQRIQFLVRDWQNFSEEWPDDDAAEERSRVFRSLRESMKLYLDKVLKPRDVDDLQSTRDQILRCFDNVDCFLLPHPGIAVTKRTFSGAIGQIDPFFRALINRYVREVFDARLEAKLVHGRSVGPRELLNYFRVFVSTFQASSQGFPKAMTLLDATAEANNRNALDAALEKYKTALSAVAGEHCPYQQENAILVS